MNKKGTYLFILLIVLFIAIGGVYASDNNQSSSDAVGMAVDGADDFVSVDASDADEDKVAVVDESPTAVDKDTVVGIDGSSEVDTNSTKELDVNDSNKKARGSLKASSDDGPEEVLGATADNEVLGVDVTGTYYYNLYTAIGGTANEINIKSNLAANYYATFLIFGGYFSNIEVSRSNFVVNGEGHSLDPSPATDKRTFNIQNGQHDITFNNIQFIKGNMQGAAVNIGQNCRNIRFVGCTFSNNQGENGAAVYIAAGCTNIVFDGCTFTGNHASSSGSAIYAIGSEVIIDGCDFTNNYIEASSNGNILGGAVNIVSATKVSISNSYFENNRI